MLAGLRSSLRSLGFSSDWMDPLCLFSPTGSKTEPSPRPSRQSLSIRHTLLGGGKGESRSPSQHSPKPEQERKNMLKGEKHELAGGGGPVWCSVG